MKKNRSYIPSRAACQALLGDVYGGLTAAVIALPLALAFGVASGAGAAAGLYGAIATGFFAAVFGGTRSQVTGPTGPMTVVMATIIAQHAGSLAEAFAIVILGGIFQIIFGIMRLGRFVTYTPYSVVSGFMSGIGIIIIFIQIPAFVGLPSIDGGPAGIVRAWSQIAEGASLPAAIIAALALGIMIFWPARLARYAPAPLIALVFGSLFAGVAFDTLPVIGTIPTGLPTLQIPAIDLAKLSGLIQPALTLALLGSIDSLLTSLVADAVTRTQHKSNRELIGQGLGNLAAGLFGGLPGAGATMRTVINIRAGGTSPLSGALHALILLAIVLGLGPIAEKIPHAVLAGILIKIGWDIIDWGYLKRVARAPKDKVAVMFVTLGLTVFVDLITAVAVGLILAAFVTARWMETEELKGLTMQALDEEEKRQLNARERASLAAHNGKIGLMSLRGRFSYASARELTRRAGASAWGYEIMIFDFTGAAHIDTSAALAIEELISIANTETKACIIAGLSGQAETTLRAFKSLDTVPGERIVPTRREAITLAATLLTAPAPNELSRTNTKTAGVPPGGFP